MTCDCISEMGKLLAEHNTKLGVTLAFPRDGTPGFCLPHIHTEKIERRQRKGPALAIPTFCPFCGTKYDEDKTARQPNEAGQ